MSQRNEKVVRLRVRTTVRKRFGATDFASMETRWLAETKLADGERSLVEAAGVEPASESVSSQNSTCVSALQISLTTSKSDEKSWPASPGGSHDSRPRRPTITSPLNGASSPVADAQERGVAVN